LPQEVLDGFKKVEDIDCFEFVDGIDPESCAYMYFNQLNQFRYEFTVSNKPFNLTLISYIIVDPTTNTRLPDKQIIAM
jgi:hypothetical protein